MFVHWDDLEVLSELGVSNLHLDLKTGHFVEHPTEATRTYYERTLEHTRWNVSPMTVRRMYEVMCALRVRRAVAFDQPALLALFDDIGTPAHDAVLAAYVAAMTRPERRARYEALLTRVIAEREDRARPR